MVIVVIIVHAMTTMVITSGQTPNERERLQVLPKEVIELLTESQSQIHLAEPWFHRGLSRDVAQKILASHNVDGYDSCFLIYFRGY